MRICLGSTADNFTFNISKTPRNFEGVWRERRGLKFGGLGFGEELGVDELWRGTLTKGGLGGGEE